LPLAPLTLTARKVKHLKQITSTTIDDARFTHLQAGPSRRRTPPPETADPFFQSHVGIDEDLTTDGLLGHERVFLDYQLTKHSSSALARRPPH
jgi:hypothetical protein